MEETAHRLILGFLAERGTRLEELGARPKGDELKSRSAAELSEQPTMTVAWIARALDAATPQTPASLQRSRQEASWQKTIALFTCDGDPVPQQVSLFPEEHLPVDGDHREIPAVGIPFSEMRLLTLWPQS